MPRAMLAALIIATAAEGLVAQGARGGAIPAGPVSLDAAADRIFAQFNSTHSPGCAVGVRQNRRDLLLRGYGMANLETHTPITAATIFESGSVAKQFTAMAVLMLVKDGKLSLDDPVRKHIPELPEYPRPLLLRHLLSHTSGLREWSNLVALAGWPRGTRVHNQQDLFEYVVAQKSLNYPVGDYYSYTNSGFALLPTIVERVSGMPFTQFSNDRIFKPLGLVDTHWRDDFTTIVPGRAQAYARRAGSTIGWELDMPFENVHGPGGLLTTVSDWLRWNEHLSGQTMGADVMEMMTTRAVLTSGRSISYARGVTVGQYRGTTEIAHSGSTGGYSTYLARYPDKNLSIAVLCNASGAPATAFTRALVDALVPGLTPAAPADTVAADAASLARLSGVYRSTRTHEPLNLTAAGRGGAIRAVRGGGWLLGNSRLIVEAAPDGSPKSVSVIGADADTVTYARVSSSPWTPTQEQLAAFAGRYRSEEVNATWTVSVEGGRLVASVRGAVRTPMTPVYPDAFSAGAGLGTVWFVRDARGVVTEMHSGSARVWDFTFTKVK
jgi:CubicO group peptidase (beta-lactamase class C family)